MKRLLNRAYAITKVKLTKPLDGKNHHTGQVGGIPTKGGR
jgi:hypothetical protein